MTPPFVENIPGCCTAALIFGLGEHGEKSEVTVERINKLCAQKEQAQFSEDGYMMDNAKRCIMSISVDRANIKTLQAAGFKVIGRYRGVQGIVHILARGLMDE